MLPYGNRLILLGLATIASLSTAPDAAQQASYAQVGDIHDWRPAASAVGLPDRRRPVEAGLYVSHGTPRSS